MIFGVRAVVDDGAHSFYLLIDDVFKFPSGAQSQLVAASEVSLLTLAHLGDGVEKFARVHALFIIYSVYEF